MEEKITGVVIWFDKKKGYGFLKRDDSADDIFVHYREIEMNGYKSLEENQRVKFFIGMNGEEKKRAMEVEVIEDEQNFQYESVVMEEEKINGQQFEE